MTDALYTRCLSEVTQAMEAEPHLDFCTPADYSACVCNRDQRLASRLARMLAAGCREFDVILGEANALAPVEWNWILRAVAAARERTDG